MPANTQPIFPNVPRIAVANLSAANTTRASVATGSLTNGVLILAAGSNGSRIDQITVQATGTTTAGMVRLWLAISGTAHLYDEFPVTAVTPSGSVVTFRDARLYTTLVLPSTASLYATTHNAEAFNVTAHGGDY